MMNRRAFARLTAVTAGIAALNLRAFAAEQAGPVARLSSNENPWGPSPAALKAIQESMAEASRYPDEFERLLIADLARLHAVSQDQILLGNGSSELLNIAVQAFTSPDRSAVMAKPTFELIRRHAVVKGAPVIEIPLTRDFKHDLGRMLQAKNAGLVYICNPNNPTASITPKDELRLAVGGFPLKTTVVVDEAYHHYVESDRYESLIPLVSARENVVVLRTFSKIYGMAGLRAGYAVGKGERIEQMRRQASYNNMSLPALVAARASLADAGHVERHRGRNSETRATVVKQLAEMGFRTIPSEANFIMVELGREVRPVITALRSRGVEVGRVFPALPTHLRVTIGTPEEMTRFVAELTAVLS